MVFVRLLLDAFIQPSRSIPYATDKKKYFILKGWERVLPVNGTQKQADCYNI